MGPSMSKPKRLIHAIIWISEALNSEHSVNSQSCYFNKYKTFGDHGGTVVKVLCYKSEGRWFDPRWCRNVILPITFQPWSASNRNEYQEDFLGVKAASA